MYLDNGLFENGEPEGPVSLLSKAKILKPTVVFAPDILYKDQDTRTQFAIFNALKRALKLKFKTAYVVQASNPLDFLNAYKWAEREMEIDMICLSILSVPRSFG